MHYIRILNAFCDCNAKPALLFTRPKIQGNKPLPPFANGDVPKLVESLPLFWSLSIIEIVARRMDTRSPPGTQVQAAAQISVQDRSVQHRDAFSKWDSLTFS